MSFIYKLNALVRCHEVEVATCELEANEIRIHLQKLEQTLSDIEQEIQMVEQGVNKCWSHLSLYRSGMIFLQEKRLQQQALGIEVDQAQDALKEIQKKIVMVRTKIRQLEKHHEKLYEEYKKQQQKLLFNESDDMWLRFIRYKGQENVC